MKESLLGLLICPGCLPVEAPLEARRAELSGDEIWAGALECARCGASYPVEEGIARLLPLGSSAPPSASTRYEEPAMLSAYLWSHYADLCGDADATPAYSEWAEQISGRGSLALDAGCATGRFTFELGAKCGLAIGLDRSEAFIRKARQILLERRLGFLAPEEGLLFSDFSCELPAAWEAGRVEFVVGDAQALPFRSDAFAVTASLNVIDKIPKPLAHLSELDRVAKENGAELLFSDPFSWSEEAASTADWLGGVPDGPFAGRGMDNIRGLLCGRRARSPRPWEITAEGAVWWKIRSHRNRFELIRSCFVKAVR